MIDYECVVGEIGSVDLLFVGSEKIEQLDRLLCSTGELVERLVSDVESSDLTGVPMEDVENLGLP